MDSKRRLPIIFSVVLVGTVSIIFMMKSWHEFVDDANKRQIENHAFTNIEVVTGNATVEIITTKDSTTTVEYTGNKRKNVKYIFNADVKGDTLFIQLKEKRRNFFNFDFSFSKIALTVKIPEKQYDMIRVESDNGHLKMVDILTDDLSFTTDNGTIELKNIVSKTINVKTDNGKVILTNVDGKINGRTDNGSISLVSNNLDRTIDLRTDNGGIEIKTEKEPTNATINVKTDNGKVDVFGKTDQQTVFGKGENKIKLRTDNGRITVTK